LVTHDADIQSKNLKKRKKKYMDITFPSYMVWWVTVIDIPVVASLFLMIWRSRKEFESKIESLHRLLETRHAQMRDSLSAYKLEVAKTYSTQAELRMLEGRLVDHLLRIESKLDKHIQRNAKG
jgi:hypothetical protein